MSTYKARKDAANKGNFSHLKLLTTSALTAAGLVASGHAVAEPAPGTTPGFTIESGVGTVDTSTPGLEVINQGSKVLTATAPKINLARDAKLQILGQAKDDIFAGRATSRVGLSQLFGKVEANGIVVFTDPNGFVVGQSFVADVNSIVLGSGDLSIEELTEGDRFTFFNTNEGAKIEIHEGATINVAEAGIAAFVAPTVKNAGTINAKLGKVAFAAGESVTVDLYGDGLFEVAVDGELADAYLENTGEINAEGGVVQMTALAAKDVADNIINLDGVVDVASATVKGGKIVLSGGNKGVVNVEGKADASGTDGGEIDIKGQNINIAESAELSADGGEGTDGNGDGGSVVFVADNAAIFRGEISATGGANGGDGGFVDTSGLNYIEVNGDVDVSADNGEGGLWLIDPRDIIITSGSSQNASTNGSGVFFPNSGGNNFAFSFLNVVNLTNALNNGSNVRVTTIGSPNGGGDGDIEIDTTILKSSGGDATLTLEAESSIFFTGGTGIASTAGALNLDFDAGDNININRDINTNGGSVDLEAEAFGGRFGTQQITISSDINTNGGDFIASSEVFNIDDGSDGNHDSIVTAGGNVNISVRDDIVFGSNGNGINRTLIDAGTGTVSFDITDGDTGSFSLGDDNGGIHLSQAEIAAIDAGALTVGDSDTSLINVDNVDTTTATIDGLVTLTTGNVNNTGDEDINFAGNNTFNALTVNADDDINFAAGSKVEVLTGDATFNGDENDGSVGNFVMGTNSLVDTNGNKIVVDSLDVILEDDARLNSEGGDISITARDDFSALEGNVTLNGDAEIDAEGGNITIDNDGVFSGGKDSVRTQGAGTIAINQNRGTAGGASIQNVIDAIQNTGTGQNTIFTDSSTYTENLTVDQANLKIDGDNTVIVAANAANQLINVIAANFNLDPVTLDGANLVDYGIFADGIGADGLVSDGNTFKNFNEAGIYIARNAATTGTIIGNTFEGSSTRGVETGTLNGGYTLNITDNTIGTDGDEVLNGLLFGEVRDATVNVTGGSIDAGGGSGSIDGDGINFTKGLFNGADVTISNVEIVSDGDEAIDVHQATRSGSKLKISGGKNLGGNNGVEFAAIDGDITIENTNIVGFGADKRGVNMLGNLGGTLTITNSNILGGDDGIGSNDSQNNTIDGGTLRISGGFGIGGKTSDGIELGKVSNGGQVIIDDITVYTGDNGVNLTGGVDNGTVTITNGDFRGNGNGVVFGDVVTNGSNITVTDTSLRIGKDGILFDGVVDGGSTVNITGGSILSRNVTAELFYTAPADAFSALTITPGVSSVAGADGVDFAHGIDGANVDIKNVDIEAASTDGNGIHVNPNTLNNRSLTNSATLDIEGNTITAGQDGVEVAGVVSGNSTVNISNSNDITGQQNGISFEEVISGNATVTIADNTLIEGVNGDGAEFKEVISGSATVSVTGNDSIVAGENGVSFEDTISGGATITVSGNNDGIEADDHGIYFGGVIAGNADIDIHDNIIQANLDQDTTGSGIWFGGAINNADVNIGDGNGGNGVITASPSNVIFVAKTGGSNTNLDGIHFDDTIGNNADIEIDGNRIGYKAPSGLGGNIVGGFTNEIANDGIAFDGAIEGNADIDITDNFINADDEGIEFDETISGTVDIEIGGSSGDTNTIIADDNAIQFGGNVTGQSLIEVSHNDIDAFGNGIVFGGVVNNAVTSGSNEQEIYIAFNDINVDEDGIVFEEDVRNARHDQLITKNTIDAEENGIVYEEDIDDAHVRIINENNINARFDAIAVRDDLQNGARLDINNNTNIIAQFGDGVEISEDINGGSVLNIQNNDNIDAGDNGIEINGVVTGGSSVNITGNNDGITANNHGIYFGSAINGNSTVNIHDNIIDANDNNGGTGDGVRFDGTITNADINIGDGSLPGGSDRSNIISGRDGIHFADTVGNGADIEIDGNRIGFAANSLNGTLFNARLADDGIQFSGVTGNANINITENAIRARDKGVVVNGEVDGTATVTVGGTADLANAINTLGDGVAFNEDVTENALIEVSYNDIDVNGNGIAFYGDVDNVAPIGISQEEILLTNNDIDIYDTGNGILFDGEVSDNRHDTRIANNNIFVRNGGANGILFNDTVDDASIWIVENDRIHGDEDGIKFNGNIENNARIRIHDNIEITGDDQDGIDFNGDITSGSFVSIIDNDAINGDLSGLESSFDSGIEFDGEINNAKIQILENNDGIMAEDHGIAFNDDILNGSDIDIHDNIIMSNTDNGQDGAGIWFGGEIWQSDVNIGDGTLNGAPSNIISVGDNFVSSDVSDLDGIHFDDTIGAGADILIDGNRIGYKVGKEGLYVEAITDDGIEFSTIRRDAVVEVTDNRIHADDDGIQFSNRITDNAQVTIGETEEDADGNKIWAGDDGISFLGQIRENAVVNVNTNEIDADDNGIFSRGGMKGGELTITDNHSIVGGNNGIKIIGDLLDYEGTDALINITGNDEILGQEANGVYINDFANDGSNVNIGGPGEGDGNIINGNGENGIEVAATSIELLIEGNETNDNGNDGILLRAKGAFVSEEEEPDFDFEEFSEESFTTRAQSISELLIFNPKEEEVGVFNSTIINNDISNNGSEGLHVDGEGHNNVILAGNTFTDNPTGARFESGKVDLTDTENPNIFTVTEDFMAPEGFEFVTGMQFELSNEEKPTSLTIVDETLGRTIFEGYGDRPVGEAYYVRFEDGAILDELGNVIEIDGTLANWDGVIPVNTSNFLTSSQLAAIEDRLFDADDPALNGRGQIFVGSVLGLNPEDFLQDRGFGEFGTSGLNVTVTGLPAIDGTNLAAIQPAAGEEGETPEDLAAIEPAAGGEEAACWGDAIDAASTGAPVNYSYGGTFEESLSDASACSSTFQ